MVIRDATTKNETYSTSRQLDLQDHFHIIDSKAIPQLPELRNEEFTIKCLIEYILNDSELTFFDNADKIPPWRVDVFPLGPQAGQPRLLVSFTYSHSHADGMSGPAFHKTLLQSMNRMLRVSPEESSTILSTTKAHLPGLPQMPVSLSYLLAPALGHYLPEFVRRWFGFKGSVSGADDDTWTGSQTFVGNDGGPIKTVVEVLSIDHETISAVLNTCRKHDTKLTSVLNEVIAHSLARQHAIGIQALSRKLNFVSSTPNNLRKVVGRSNDVIGVFASTAYTIHVVHTSTDSESDITLDNEFWTRASQASKSFAVASSTLQDQPIGLLRFISDINGWMKGHIDHKRDASWELSNLMSFDGGSGDDEITVEKMYFCQPADAAGMPLTFNVISVQGGDLVICVGWQPSALGICTREEAEDFERKFVKDLTADMRKYFEKIAQS